MKWLFCFLVVLNISIGTHAEDFPGGNSATTDEFEKGFSKEKGMQDEDHRQVEADRLKIGGYLQAEWMVYQLEKSAVNDFITSPLTLETYLDAQMKNDVRAFFKGRFMHDAAVDENVLSPLTGAKQKQNTNSLDEMKISFHTQRKVFWTIGRQKIKWGAARFWNPTDFLNLQKRDFLRQEDVRSGVSMVKAHIPWNDANFYVLGVNEAAQESSQNGLGGRIELPFSASEWSVTSYSRKGQKTKLGTDISFAVRDFDVYFEGAQSDLATDKSASGGFSYEVRYNDQDTVLFGLESFWQESGVDDKSKYAAMVTAGTFVPFYVAKSYTAASVYLMKPGSWNLSNFLFYAMANNNDRSQYYRVTWIYSGVSDMQWTFALGGRIGESGSEMKLFNQTYDGWLQLRVAF